MCLVKHFPHLLLHLRGKTSPVVCDTDPNAITGCKCSNPTKGLSALLSAEPDGILKKIVENHLQELLVRGEFCAGLDLIFELDRISPLFIG